MSSIRFHKSLRARIMAFLGGLFLFLFVFVVAAILIFVCATEREAWRERQSEAAENASHLVADYLQQNENILVWLDKYGFEEIQRNPDFLPEVLKDNPAFLEITYVDEGGTPHYGVAQDQPMLANQFTILQSEWFRVASSGQKYYSHVQTSSLNKSYIIFAMPSQHGGAFVAQIKMDALWEKVEQIHFGKTGSVYVVNQNGQVIAHPDRQIVLANQNIGDTTLFKTITRSPGRIWIGNSVNFDGVNVVSVSMPIESTEWIVISELPQKEAYAVSLRASTLIPTVVILLIAVVTVMFRRVLITSIIQPLNLLRQGADQIRQGNLGFRIASASRDEFGEVMAVFNDMAASLEEQQDNLQKAIAYEYESRRARELDILLRASEATSASLDLDTVLHTLASNLLEISGFESCFISEWDQAANTVMGRVDHSRTFWREDKRDIYFLSEFPRSASVLETGVPVMLQGDFEAEEKQWMDELRRTAVIILALQAKGETIGLVELATTRKGYRFDPQVLPACQEILMDAAPSLAEPLSANDPKKLFEIEERLLRVSRAEVCSLSEWDKPGNRVLTLAVSTNITWPAGQGARFKFDLETWRQALEQGKTITFVRSENNTIKADVFDGEVTTDVESLIVFPLQRGEERIGVIELNDFNHRIQVSPEQIALLRTLADKASYSIENARLFAQTQQLLMTDHLTELFNMRYFLDFAAHEFERIQRYERTASVAMVDLDHFKTINDTHGHAMGDAILREIAGRIRGSVRTVDIVARYGGEEFVVLMLEAGMQEAHQIAERVRQVVAEHPVHHNGVSMTTTVSVGVAEINRSIKSMDALINHADQALYKAKANGRNRVEVFHTTDNPAS